MFYDFNFMANLKQIKTMEFIFIMTEWMKLPTFGRISKQ